MIGNLRRFVNRLLRGYICAGRWKMASTWGKPQSVSHRFQRPKNHPFQRGKENTLWKGSTSPLCRARPVSLESGNINRQNKPTCHAFRQAGLSLGVWLLTNRVKPVQPPIPKVCPTGGVFAGRPPPRRTGQELSPAVQTDERDGRPIGNNFPLRPQGETNPCGLQPH